MIIRTATTIRQNYGLISQLCKTTQEPVYLTKNGEEDLVVMDISAFEKREKQLRLESQLLEAEKSYLHADKLYSIEELEIAMSKVAEEVIHDR